MRRGTALLLAALLLAGCTQTPAAPDSGSSQPPADSASSSGDVSAPSSRPPEWDGTSGVLVDWSKLGNQAAPQPDVDGGRWYPEYTGTLLPREDYGPLVPFLGDQAYSFQRWEYEGEVQEYFSEWPTSFYGLMTREGKIVVDPVYQHADLYTYTWEGKQHSLPVLLLARVDEAWKDVNNGLLYAAAAEDGSWMTDFEFINYTNKDDQLLLFGLQGVTQLDSATGARKDWTWDELGVSEELLPETLGDIQWVMGWNWTDHGVYLGWKPLEEGEHGVPTDTIPVRAFQPETGEVSWVDGKQWDQWYRAWSDRRWPQDQAYVQEGDRTGLILDGQFYPLEDAPGSGFLESRAGDLITIWDTDEGNYLLYRLSTGELLEKDAKLDLRTDLNRPGSAVLLRYQGGVYTACDTEFRPLFVLPPCPADRWLNAKLRDGLFSFQAEGEFFGCYDLDAGKYVFFRNLGLGD